MKSPDRSHPARQSEPAELARAVLRGALASTMIAHGIRHGRTIDGTAGWFESIGFEQPRLQAQLSSAVEVSAGLALAASAQPGQADWAARHTPLPKAAQIQVQDGGRGATGRSAVGYRAASRPR